MATNNFNVDKVYTLTYNKKELIRLIENCYDEDFIITFLPRTTDNADILIRSFEKIIKQGETIKKL